LFEDFILLLLNNLYCVCHVSFYLKGESNSLLGHHHSGSNSDLSTHLCEIDDSEYEDHPRTNVSLPPGPTAAMSTGPKVKWAPSVQQTQV